MSDQTNTITKKPAHPVKPPVNPYKVNSSTVRHETTTIPSETSNIVSGEETKTEPKLESKKVKKTKTKRPRRNLLEIIHDRKQQRYLKVKNSKWAKFNRNVFNALNHKKKLKIEWLIIGIVSLVLIAFFGTLLGIMQRFIGLSQLQYPSVYNARDLNSAMRIISIFCLAFLVVPYFYVMAAFFSGINQIHKSKTVHFIIWFTMMVDALLLIACCGMLIAGYYGLDSFNLARNLV